MSRNGPDNFGIGGHANDGSSATGELRETFDADKTKQTDGSR
jgi:hypothetical protein